MISYATFMIKTVQQIIRAKNFNYKYNSNYIMYNCMLEQSFKMGKHEGNIDKSHYSYDLKSREFLYSE